VLPRLSATMAHVLAAGDLMQAALQSTLSQMAATPSALHQLVRRVMQLIRALGNHLAANPEQHVIQRRQQMLSGLYNAMRVVSNTTAAHANLLIRRLMIQAYQLAELSRSIDDLGHMPHLDGPALADELQHLGGQDESDEEDGEEEEEEDDDEPTQHGPAQAVDL
jgi:hypothetical protein